MSPSPGRALRGAAFASQSAGLPRRGPGAKTSAFGLRAWHARFCVASVLVALATDASADEGAAEAPWVLKGKFGDGVTFESPDGKTGLNLGARIQMRGTGTLTEGDPDKSGVDAVIRRLRVTLQGHTFGEALTFKIQLASATQDVDPEAPSIVRDAFVTWSPLRDLRLRAGQTKVPFGRQRTISSGNLQLADRSLANAELNIDRDVGAYLFSDDLFGQDRWLGYRVGLFSGDGRNRIAAGSGLLVAGRLELRPAGGGTRIEDGEPDLERSPRPRLTIGASAVTNRRSDRERSTFGGIYETGAWVDYVHFGGDYSFKWNGLSLSGETWIREAEEDTNTKLVDGTLVTDRARTGWGGYVQAGQMIGPIFEIVGRLGATLPLGPPGDGFPAQREIGGGVSAYILEHALKIQTDAFRLISLDEALLPHQTVFRLQLQVAP